MEFKLNEIVYHRDVYHYKEPLKIKGITNNSLLLEGDFSGESFNQPQMSWFPIKGTSRIYNHAFKEEARKNAVAIEALLIPCAGSKDRTYLALRDMMNCVLVLTKDIDLNPKY